MLKRKSIAIMLILVILILLLPSIFTPKEKVNGTYYGEGDFGTIKIIVKENNDIIKYYFNFNENYVKQILEAKTYFLQFVANKKFNINCETYHYTAEDELLYRGVFRGPIRKPFTLLNFRVGTHSESIKLKKID